MRRTTKAALACAALGVASLILWPVALLVSRRRKPLSRRPALHEEYDDIDWREA